MSKYRDPQLKKELAKCSFGKCVYCEGNPNATSYLEIEHFEPKSLYPDRTFDWNNLLVACRKCNNSKRSHDTRNFPIIDPSITNPEDLFKFLNFEIISNTLDPRADLTIEVCHLNRVDLMEERAKFLNLLNSYLAILKIALEKVSRLDRRTKNYKTKRQVILSSITEITKFTSSNSEYSLLMLQHIQSDQIYIEATSFIAN